MSFGETLSNKELEELRDRCMVTAQRVVDMDPEESRTTPEGKHTAPLEGGFVNAIFAELAQRELDRRAAALDALERQARRREGLDEIVRIAPAQDL